MAVVKTVDIDILPTDVIYRSGNCRDKIFTSRGTIQGMGITCLPYPLSQNSVAILSVTAWCFDGGGECKWKLSNIIFQFKYHELIKFGEKVENNTPEDIVFMFDDAPPRGNGHYENISGDFVVKKVYYLVVLKCFTESGGDVVYIKGQSMLTYRVSSVNSILFESVLYSDMTFNVFSPRKKGDGYLIVYPNREEVAEHSLPYSDEI